MQRWVNARETIAAIGEEGLKTTLHVVRFCSFFVCIRCVRGCEAPRACFDARVPQFMHLDGAILTPLVAAVPSVAGWRLAGLRKAIDAADAQRLLASCDRRTAVGARDLAILTTLAPLGLRAGEVAALGLDDLDWRRGEITISRERPSH